ncbi:hypothetical protein EYF80_000165 [Liparis tanakae]|uniref:Uncharacterized protein n=1 Tax=Liparis tanakae TaxID=230148 RepID=A0A4Z2JJY9_9TELE|nr:hypothetical protein EYF80_000165 [Liparis tanakae]
MERMPASQPGSYSEVTGSDGRSQVSGAVLRPNGPPTGNKDGSPRRGLGDLLVSSAFCCGLEQLNGPRGARAHTNHAWRWESITGTARTERPKRKRSAGSIKRAARSRRDDDATSKTERLDNLHREGHSLLSAVFSYPGSTNGVHDLTEAQQEAGGLADMSAGPGRRLQTGGINQPLATGRPNKMADGSAGAKMSPPELG